ncbi:MAG: acyl-CoA/acyl-ACP dehydrogenase [Rhodospirillales bacterium]|nr:acyl-CoA/acyl-ACP dehydrogenase [Rhodospirillales bacterium]
MDFDFPDELKQLRAEAGRFLADRCPPAAARKVLEGGGLDRALWAELGTMGWLGAALPEAHGGAGLGHLALCVLSEEIGRALAPLPWASSVCLGAEAIARFGSPAQQARLLPGLADGSRIATLALAEGPGPFDPARLKTRADDGRLSGVKTAVPDAAEADLLLIATAGPGPLLWVVERGAAGLTVTATPGIDPARPVARLDLAAVPAEPLAGADGPDAIRRLIDRAAVTMAFEQLGCAEAALHMARDYARGRYAFGRAIGSFQAIKHKLADVYIAIELARSNAYYGAWALESDAAELPVAAAVARIAACEAGWIAGKENIQTHGGMGFTWAFDCHLFYRRARAQAQALGSAREWKHRLIAELAARNAPARSD